MNYTCIIYTQPDISGTPDRVDLWGMQGKFRDSQKNNLGAFSKSELLFQKFFLSKRVFGWIVGVSTFLMLSNLRWQSEWQRVGLVRQVIDIVSKKRTPLKVSLKPTYGYAASKIDKQIRISLYKCVREPFKNVLADFVRTIILPKNP